MKKLKEHITVKLNRDIKTQDKKLIKKGSKGVIVYVYENVHRYEVEFPVKSDAIVVTVLPSWVKSKIK